MGITLDGVTYNVRVMYPSVIRTFNIPQGSAQGKSLAYSDIDDIFGTEYGYTMSIEPMTGEADDYDAFYEAISAPVGTHTVTLPYGQSTITFSCKVTGGADTYYGKRGANAWRGLSVNFMPTHPQRTV